MHIAGYRPNGSEAMRKGRHTIRDTAMACGAAGTPAGRSGIGFLWARSTPNNSCQRISVKK